MSSNIPTCPECDTTHWLSTEVLSGGRRRSELIEAGWRPLPDDSDAEALLVKYTCAQCGFEASDELYENLASRPTLFY